MKKKPPKEKTDQSEIAHHNAILMEEMKSEFKFVVEAVEGNRETLEAQIGQVKTELKQDIADTRAALQIRIDRVEKGLRQEMAEMKTELSGKIDKIGEHLERHDREIVELKKAQNLD